MNHDLRKYLIDVCRNGYPVNYSDVGNFLGLDFSNAGDRKRLSEELGAVSQYEYLHKRPLISSGAIYKDKGDHGPGFYNLCEELGVGNAKKLHESQYGFVAFNESKDYWNDNAKYTNFYELIDDAKYDLPFFNEAELEFFKQWADKPYNPEDTDHINAKEFLMETVWSKTQLWSREVINRTLEYTTSNGRYWSKPDWLDGERIAGFKPYTWARIYKFGDKNKDIFFTVGVDALREVLVYKLDYFQESKSKLNKEQKYLCEKFIPREIRWQQIPFTSLNNYDWTKLINETVDFISKNNQHYDQLINIVWKDTPVDEAFNNSLTLRKFPDGGLTSPPNYNPSFNGTNVDFLNKNIEAKELGDAGEDLVKDYEYNRLSAKGMFNEAKNVKIVKDGKGYDVLSFDDNGDEVYIEVKTTTGNEKTPFYLSRNEMAFSEQNINSYHLFRIYNYDQVNNRGDFFIIHNPSKTQFLVPTNYIVYIKKQD